MIVLDASAILELLLVTEKGRSVAERPHDVLLDRIWELRHNASAYDAAYLALAEALDAPLLTSDARLGAVPDARAAVEIL